MGIPSIKSKKDYDLALIEVEKLWGAPVGSFEGDKLEELIKLIEAYELKFYPVDLP